jgi:carboxyl-terminal processing protease
LKHEKNSFRKKREKNFTRKIFMKQKIILLAILFAAFLPLKAQTAALSDNQPKVDGVQLRRQSFDKVWNIINEKHYDKTFGGVDWQKMREIYEPKAMAAKTLNEFHAVLRQMLGELKLSHFGIFPQNAQVQANQSGGGITGIEIKMIDGQPLICRIEKDSTAEKAGLKACFTIKKIDGKSIETILAPLEKIISERTQNERVKMIYRERTVAFYLDGKPETSAQIEVLNTKNEPQIFDVRRYAGKAEMSEAVGNFPAQEVVFEAKRLESDIGYIRFNVWVVPQMPKIRQAIRDFADTKGIIFDLRGNPGGIGGMASGVAGLLMTQPSSLGSMTGRETEQKFAIYPQSNPFLGKIIILTDYATGSTSEVFAAGLQDLGRAKTVGERSAGAVLPSVFDTLPTGAIFQYAISDYKSPKNVLIEGRGVLPDTEVKQTRRSLLDGHDLPLEAAVRQILN